MEQKNLKRIQKILTGDYKDNTEVIVGYTKAKDKYVERNEGDVWTDESNKTWTIKNGIRQNITKLDSIRDMLNVPLSCPKCGKAMNKRLDKKFWFINKHCFDCQINEDNDRIINGTFVEYSRQIMKKNADAFVSELKDQVKSYLDTFDSKHFITEVGDIEEWVGGKTKEDFNKIFEEKFEKLDEIINDKLSDNEVKENTE